jgi:hypothetical protein
MCQESTAARRQNIYRFLRPNVCTYLRGKMGEGDGLGGLVRHWFHIHTCRYKHTDTDTDTDTETQKTRTDTDRHK